MANERGENSVDAPSPDIADRSDVPPGSGGGFFEIHVEGHLNSKWSDWLEGLEMRLLDNGEMILFGPVVDQAALIGILNKLSRLNLTLLSVNQADKSQRSEAK